MSLMYGARRTPPRPTRALPIFGAVIRGRLFKKVEYQRCSERYYRPGSQERASKQAKWIKGYETGSRPS